MVRNKLIKKYNHTLKYYERLKAQGLNAVWYSQKNGTHNSVVTSEPTLFDQAIGEAIHAC